MTVEIEVLVHACVCLSSLFTIHYIAACLGYLEALAHSETDLLSLSATYVWLHSSINDIMMVADINFTDKATVGCRNV